MTRDEKTALIGGLVLELQETVREKTLCGEAITQAGETLRQLGQSLAEFTCKSLSDDDRRALDGPRIEQLLARYAELSKRAEELRRRKAELGF